MVEKSWPDPDTVPADEVTDVEYERLMSTLVPNGFRGSPNDAAMVFGDGTGKYVKIRANSTGGLRGFGWSAGDTTFTKAIADNATSNPRRDTVVLRLTRSDWKVRTAVKTGVAAVNPAWPLPTQDLDVSGDGTGVFEITMARVTARPGFTSILGTDVLAMSPFVAPQRLLCKAATKPPHQQFLEICEVDTGKIYMSNGVDTWIERSADTGWIDAVSNLAGWNADVSSVSRLDGQVTVKFSATRTGGATTAGTEMALINDGFRPGVDLDFPVYMFGSPTTYNMALVGVKATGVVNLGIHFGVQTGTVILGTFTYPARS
jgi:hypothetical protein